MPSSRLIWHRHLVSMTNDEIALRHQYYYFNLFSMCLNEPTSSINLPSTDSRYRQDIRYLENGDIDAASNEKHRLEEQQRSDAKKRDFDFQPLWFKQDTNGEYVYTNQYEERKFEQCPNLFSRFSLK